MALQVDMYMCDAHR